MAWDGLVLLLGWAVYEDLLLLLSVLIWNAIGDCLLALEPRRTYALVVYDLDNGAEPASVFAGTKKSNTANLHVLPRACRNICVAHLAGIGGSSSSIISTSRDRKGIALLRTVWDFRVLMSLVRSSRSRILGRHKCAPTFKPQAPSLARYESKIFRDFQRPDLRPFTLAMLATRFVLAMISKVCRVSLPFLLYIEMS